MAHFNAALLITVGLTALIEPTAGGEGKRRIIIKVPYHIKNIHHHHTKKVYVPLKPQIHVVQVPVHHYVQVPEKYHSGYDAGEEGGFNGQVDFDFGGGHGQWDGRRVDIREREGDGGSIEQDGWLGIGTRKRSDENGEKEPGLSSESWRKQEGDWYGNSLRAAVEVRNELTNDQFS